MNVKNEKKAPTMEDSAGIFGKSIGGHFGEMRKHKGLEPQVARKQRRPDECQEEPCHANGASLIHLPSVQSDKGEQQQDKSRQPDHLVHQRRKIDVLSPDEKAHYLSGGDQHSCDGARQARCTQERADQQGVLLSAGGISLCKVTGWFS